jgi:hypothetical protein
MTAATVMLNDGRSFRLGRIRPKVRTLALPLARYIDLEKVRVSLPDKVDYSAKAMSSIKRVYGNDRYGDCVIAGKYHQVGIWTGNESGEPVVADDREVLSAYHKICGPGDNGCVITDVLDYFMQRGLMFGGQVHRIDGYAAVDWTNRDLVRAAIYLLGSLTLGINLPQSWTCTNCVWDERAHGNVGGHDVCAVGYDEKGVQICTWGGLVTITWPAMTSKKWIEECYVSLSPDWYANKNLSPQGLDVKALKSDLDLLKQGNMPPLPEPVPPTPPPIPPPVPPPGPQPVPQIWQQIIALLLQILPIIIPLIFHNRKTIGSALRAFADALERDT